ncbi:uncharacterized protein ces2b [Sardina pilchardus]|uniref:uncharacterized protein ces2b n=1 Tax=Sardina pilchardus TaxID=27697 RepID=UPI002E0D7403
MKPMLNLLLTACVLHLALSTIHNGPLLHTKLGVLRGDYMRVRGKTTVVHAYLGVPFATPPVGNLRLAPPQPLQGWEGVRDATQFPSMCVQDKNIFDFLMEMVNMVMDLPEVSEDCLYVNVYTPIQPAKDEKLPVMVCIHGGGFSMGSASTYDGSVLAAYQNVVVVTIQYRLGMLGFFSTGDDNAPGNLGLLDQVAALQWVQENIHSFGGDPSSVTIFGESAGGVSVSLLVLSPLSTGLFHRGIAESGTAAMLAIFNPDPMNTAKMVANATNCEGTKPDQIVDCVMRMSVEDIVKFQLEHAEVPFQMVNDGYFLPKAVPDLLKAHEFNKVPLINGVNNDECGWMLTSFMAPPDWVDGMDRDSMKTFVANLYRNPDSEISTALIMDEYLGNGEDRIKNRDSITEFCGDILFTIPAITLSNAHRDSGAPVFAYEFQHPPSMFAKTRPSFVGADHSDEIAFVFGNCFYNGPIKINGTFTEEEDELCRTMMAYWGNFARTGSPNGPGLTHWPAYGAREEYLGIGLKQQVGYHLKADRYAFMTQTLPEKIQQMKQHQQRTELIQTHSKHILNIMNPMFHLLLTACVLHLTLSTVHNGPLLHTKLGVLRGDYMRVRGKTTVVHAYRGVPFATPPVGNLRLAPPQPLQGWEGIRDATQMPPMCVQDKQLSVYLWEMAGFDVDLPEVSEDCLYVNVYTPTQPAKDTKLPVMVWIHGGGFSMGYASMYDGSFLAAYQNVVVVTIQYRLGMLGFFSTGDDNAPGNLGLLDQVAALQWVQENIHSFGGDPSSVTIFGESAGGVSVSLLVLSPLSTGLFHRAIAESGTAPILTLFSSDPMITAKMVANTTNCEGTKPDQFVDCVMRMSVEDIIKFPKEHPEAVYGVVVDGYFLQKAVPDLLKSHEFQKVPLINGVNNHECGWVIPGFLAAPDWVDGIDHDSSKTFVDNLYRNPDSKISTALIMDEYLGNGEDRIKNRDGLTEFCGDFMFTIPAITLSNAHRGLRFTYYVKHLIQKLSKLSWEKEPCEIANDPRKERLHFGSDPYHRLDPGGDSGAPVFAYEFQHPPSLLGKKRPSFVRADHGDEIAFVFGDCFSPHLLKLNATFTEEEDELCRTMMAYWGNFARTGSPNGPGLTHWPAYGAGEEYLGIGLKQQVGYHLKADRYAFMTQRLPEKIQQMKQHQQRTEL